MRPLRSSAPSRTSVAQTQQLEGLIITERQRREEGGAGQILTRPRLPMTGRPRLAKEGVKSGLQFMPLRRMGSSARNGVLLACEGTQG